MAMTPEADEIKTVAGHTLAYQRTLDKKVDLVIGSLQRQGERLARVERDRWSRRTPNGFTGWIVGLPDLAGLRCPCFVSGPLQIGGEDRIRRGHSCQQVRVRIQV